MLAADLHVHSLASRCGLHTVLELLAEARRLGLEVLAITDHDEGPGTATRVLSYRFPREWQGVRLLVGLELCIRAGGALKLPSAVKLADLDVCLAGFHPTGRARGDGPERLAADLAAALAGHPYLDVITHPTIRPFPLRPEDAARLAAQAGVALEVNNCALRYGKERREDVLAMLRACQRHGTQVVVSSDTHALPELGQDELARPLLAEAGLDPALWVNSTAERALAFVEARRAAKRAADQAAEPAGAPLTGRR
ncbi:MAG TPA: PHP domain-containing protein [Myxococcota bacterium]|nr:PHP domain-containing protein [Myxococcota bacterium]HRY94786.1 PHP domain-containing protein [Myxococcota bacterium]HSA24330.1 PHP domain-containing protein [Myxococcota bacterium]